MSDIVVHIHLGISQDPTPEDRGTKAEAHYRPMEEPDQQCGNCDHYSSGRCEIVAGSIDPDYVCDWWKERDG